MKNGTGTTIRRRDPREEARIWTGVLLAGASGLILFGLRKALADGPSFDRSVVLITGGSRGLGLALAEEFRSQGAHLALLARDREELAAAKIQLASKVPRGREILLLPCDVVDEAQVLGAVDACLRHFRRLDVLVNNAGVIQVGALASQTRQDFEEAMNVNFWGVVNTTLAVLPYMTERRAGRIVNITSIGARVSMPHLLPYSASKFAALGFSLGLRAELANQGVAVTTVLPGLMRTGSYLNATFKGNTPDEYSWFSLSSSLPGITISARSAARQIVNAAWKKKAEVVLGAPAKVGGLISSIFPGLAADVLGVVNRVLPKAHGKQARLGRESRTTVSESFATKLGQQAAEKYNQHSRPA